jgi:hypothetical protein
MKSVTNLKKTKDFSEFAVGKFRGQVAHVIQALCLIMIADDAVMLSALIKPTRLRLETHSKDKL